MVPVPFPWQGRLERSSAVFRHPRRGGDVTVFPQQILKHATFWDFRLNPSMNIDAIGSQ
jgi:hypothetical protein